MANNMQRKQHPLTYDEISHLFEQLSMLLGAGITIYDSLDIMLKDEENKDLHWINEQLLATVRSGEPLSDAIEESGVFPVYAKQLIIIGEQTGNLDTVSSAIAEFYEDEADIRESLRSAVTYPIVMVVLMFVVVIVLLSRVLPIFEQVYEQLGTSVGGFTESLMDIGKAMSRYYLALVVVFFLLAGLFIYFYRTQRGQKNLRYLLATLPFSKGFSQRLAVGRFAGGMAMTQRAGLDTFSSLTLCKQLVDNPTVQDKIGQAIDHLSKGETLSESLVAVNMFSHFYSSMINVAQKAGNVDEVMRLIAVNYKKETDRRIAGAIAAVEPTMVIILSIIVGMILLSVILPLMGIMSSIG